MDICYCGHEIGEHRFSHGHHHECEASGCPCIAYEESPEEDDDEC